MEQEAGIAEAHVLSKVALLIWEDDFGQDSLLCASGVVMVHSETLIQLSSQEEYWCSWGPQEGLHIPALPLPCLLYL